ncbi:MAG: transglutaminase domain-containing protein [Luteolibacter sp.]
MKRPDPTAKPRVARPAPATKASVPFNAQSRKKASIPIVGVFALLAMAMWIGFELMRTSPQVASKKLPVARLAPVKAPETPPSVEVAAKDVPTPVPVVPTPAPAPAVETPAAPVAPSAEAVLAARLRNEPLLVLLGSNARISHEVDRDKKLLASAAEGGAWDDYRGLLSRSLAAALGTVEVRSLRDRCGVLWKEPVFYQALLRWKVLEQFPSADIESNRYAKDLFAWMMVNNDAMEEVLLTVKSGDNKAKVSSLMADAWLSSPEKAQKYFNLMLACAVVFDTEVKAHPLGDSASSVSEPIDPHQRYLWYIDKNEKGKLATSVNRLSARDLVWVVCAPVQTSELEWAIDKMQLTRKNWGNAYGMIEYLMERAVKGLNPYKEYTFAEILKEGGICGDQSYFCVNTARALGIPAMTISGETDLGGHAWAGVKVKDDEWNTHIGRIGGASNGGAGNPQVGGSTSEQEVWLWNDRAQQSRPTTLNVFRPLWLADLLESVTQPAAAEESVRIANSLGHAFIETWVRLHDVLVRKTKASSDPGASELVDAWVDFVASMRREFRENPRMVDLAAKAETEHIFPFTKINDARRTLARERRRDERNAGEQKDLIADTLKREADLIQSKGTPDAAKEISQLYDRALRDYGGSVTGFKKMAEDYFSFASKDPENSRKAARDIELAFTRVVETGSKDWFRANTETSIYKMICSYYRTAGDEAKAEKLEKRYIRLLKEAERGAL